MYNAQGKLIYNPDLKEYSKTSKLDLSHIFKKDSN